MNIEREQFPIHIIPVSQQEIREASRSLWARIPELKDRGGFLNYLGKREDMADRCQVKFNEVAGDTLAAERLMQEYGITKVVEQLRNIVRVQGNRCELD